MKLTKSLNPVHIFSIRWQRTLVIIFIAQALTAVGFSTIFPFLPLYVEELGTSTGLSTELLAGLVYSSQSFTMMIASPFWGALADRVGRKPMVERAMFGGAIIVFMMSFVQSAEQLVVLRAIQGAVTGVVAASNALVASATPRDRTGFAMGLIQAGLGTGVALGPVIGGAIADAFGYKMTFYITAAMLLLAGFLVHFGIKEDFVSTIKAGEKVVKGFLGEWRNILQTTGIVLTFTLSFLYMLGRMMIVPIAPFFVETLLSNDALLNTVTGLVIGSAAATITISSAILGRVGDRSGHRKIVFVSASFAALLYFAQAFVTSAGQLLILQALVGVCLGGILPSISALLARYPDSGKEGAVYGLNNSIRSAGRALAPLLGGIIATGFDLRATFIGTAVIFLVIAVLSRSLPRPERPRQVNQPVITRNTDAVTHS